MFLHTVFKGLFLLHTALFRHLYAWGGITTLGARFMPLKRWTPAGHGGVFAVFMPSRNSPRVGKISPRRVHTPPQLRTAHTAAHTAKHGVFWVRVVSLPSARSARSRTSPGRVPERRALPLLGLGRGCSQRTQRAFGTAMRLCASLFRGVAAPLGCVIQRVRY